MIERIKIKNFKSIKDMDLSLNSLNVLIGSNGVGKSNFISFFELIKAIYEQRFGSYTLSNGGFDKFLYQGRKVSDSIYGLLDFDNKNAIYFTLKPTQSETGFIEVLGDYFNNCDDEQKDYKRWYPAIWDNAALESNLKNKNDLHAKYLKRDLSSFTVYHFHDTSRTSPMRSACNINDNDFLRDNGSNLAAYLYKLKNTDNKAYLLIEGVIQSIAPYFKCFDLKPKADNPEEIILKWEEQNSDMYLDGYSFSDGTLRFIALATLLLQSDLPKIIIIDEPELGLHPAAINKFAALVKKAAKKSQVILSTQSTNLVNCFEPEDIIVADRENNQSVFKRLSSTDLSVWINDYEYSLSEIWEKNLIGGQL